MILFQNKYTYIFLQEKRESLEKWVREFEGHRSKAFDEDHLVEGEEEGEKEDGGEKRKEEETEKSEEVEKCVDLENTCIVAECALDEVEDALGVCIKNIRCLKEIVKKGKGGMKSL